MLNALQTTQSDDLFAASNDFLIDVEDYNLDVFKLPNQPILEKIVTTDIGLLQYIEKKLIINSVYHRPLTTDRINVTKDGITTENYVLVLASGYSEKLITNYYWVN